MARRSILITGCSSGIGRDAALGLSRNGWRVFATCRNPEDCAGLAAEGLESFPLDYADPASIEAALARVIDATGGTLDALYNNGAYAIPGAVEDLPRDALRSIFESNLFGWHDLTRRVIPVMRAQGHGRILNCSSVLGYVSTPWRGAYSATKFALEGLTDALRLEMRDTPIKVILIQPGPIGTAFRQNAIKQFERWIDWEGSARAEQYRNSLLKRLYGTDTGDRFELPPEAVTAVISRALDHPRPRARYRVTVPAKGAGLLRRALPDPLLDRVLSRS
ncbi:SDR family NAD(P)-dependent oxidoreductase [Mesobaculum littorinae]|uniref:SDR family NAD(P)-dependent oxidoreductase n=1 Tax=Mesobaculum littorinae TaxID=2486419 RepID=A0A438AFJ4_9RHOB|nr:SDR family NAD(P)-dependent oxidoreductase [Mesobaculum littorinae]RVV97469.1 SDR family NAD(P)-dependent oxidoreductase [Mesobaculum littorinae]